MTQLVAEEHEQEQYWATRGDRGDEEDQDVATVSMSDSDTEAASSVHLQPPAAEPRTWPPSPTMSTEGPLTPPHTAHSAFAASPVAPDAFAASPVAPITPNRIPPPPPARHLHIGGGSRQCSARSGSSSSSSVETEGEVLDLSGYDGHVDLLRLMTEGARVTSGLRRALLACSTRTASPHASLQW